jgi:hypothetical protein
MKSKTSIIVGSVLALTITATEPATAKGFATVHTLGCYDCTWNDPVQLPPQITVASKSNVLIGTGLLMVLALIPFAWHTRRRKSW